MSEPVIFSQEEWRQFRTQFGEMKHTLNNALAVFMALSELAKRNPDNYGKLVDTISTRTPGIVALLQGLTETMNQKAPLPPEHE
ncbi:MAG TPA: hypothetical protein VNQ90_03370 [Chthoniobacteraceae bacterium]|nr:hypothetical protein [Chthoniobacteraceae bacterium]